MKKSAKKNIMKYWYLVFLLFPIIIVLIISCNTKKRELIVLTKKSSYLGIGLPTAVIDVACYVSERASFLLDKKNIKECKLIDNDTKATYLMEINEIVMDQAYYNYQDKRLKKKSLNLSFNYINDYMIKIPNASLAFSYDNNTKYQLDIGSVVFIKESSIDNINMDKVKGIVNNIIPDDNDLLPSTVGLVVKLTSNKTQKITKIELLNGYGEIDNAKIIECESFDIDNQIDIKKLIEYELMVKPDSKSCNIMMKKDETKILILPISYYQLESINYAGLLITNEEEETQIIDSFPIFSSTLVKENYSMYVCNSN